MRIGLGVWFNRQGVNLDDYLDVGDLAVWNGSSFYTHMKQDR